MAPSLVCVGGSSHLLYEDAMMGDLSAHFSRHEFACACGCGYDTVDTELNVVLESIRQRYDSPVHVTSGARCIAYNAEIGGAPSSMHLVAKAADIVVEGVEADEVRDWATRTWPGKYGIGGDKTYVHIDVRTRPARF